MAAVLAVVTVAAGACVFDLDPPVRCESVAAEDCDSALDMARPLLGAYWEQASEVLVHPGPCSFEGGGSCPPRFATDARWLTVELVSDQPEAAFVVIDRRTGEWTPTCAVTVPDVDGAHREPCAEQ